MSQSFLAVSDDVHMKSQIFTLKWWKNQMLSSIKKNAHEIQPVYKCM